MGMAQTWETPTSSWTTTTSATSTYVIFANEATTSGTFIQLPAEVRYPKFFNKGRFFRFESSREFRAWFKPDKIQKKPEEKARHGFQQMARIPNYRGVRTR